MSFPQNQRADSPMMAGLRGGGEKFDFDVN